MRAWIKRWAKVAFEPFGTAAYSEDERRRFTASVTQTRLTALWVSAVTGGAFGAISLAVAPERPVDPLRALLTIGGWVAAIFAVLQVARYLKRSHG
jgi:hypothetical protein